MVGFNGVNGEDEWVALSHSGKDSTYSIQKNINWGSWKIGKHSMDSWVWIIGGEHNLMQKRSWEYVKSWYIVKSREYVAK